MPTQRKTLERDRLAFIHQTVSDIKKDTSYLLRLALLRSGAKSVKVTLSGVRLMQFEEAVRLRHLRPEISLHRACQLAFRRVATNASDRGYPSWESLARYARKHREYFD